MASYQEIVWEKATKPLKFPFFNLFFVFKDPLEKFAAKNQNSTYIILGNIVHIQAQYRRDRMKTEGAYTVWKSWRADGQTDDRRLGIG